LERSGRKKASYKPKSGRERKAKRKTLKKVDDAIVDGGKGDHWTAGSVGEELANAKLILKAIKNRWLTNKPEQSFEGIKDTVRSAKETAMLMTCRGMRHVDQDVVLANVKNLIAMEGQNQKDVEIAVRVEERVAKTREEAGRPNQPHLHLHGDFEMSGDDVLDAMRRIDEIDGKGHQGKPLTTEEVREQMKEVGSNGNGQVEARPSS